MGKTVSFQALGRDVQAAADSQGDSAFSNAVKDLVVWFAGDNYLNGLWSVTASSTDSSATLSFSLAQADAYVVPDFPGAPELQPENEASQVAAANSTEEPAGQADDGAAPVDIENPPVDPPADPPADAPVS